ncbi:GNAT family N-acetyltransferase [Haladaptatus sp. DYSN1]|uniref:GNAT family N-acetyltransferase n=1 Tax=unclassified Haladaptatus TaxID=2622732 RepID=UPI00240704D5|nr:GNAT family N-acetyltransferase [Haladaptatus sp. DYSN1]
MAVHEERVTTDHPEGGYTVRWYEAGDEDAFVDLYGLAFSGCTPEWFDWKYKQNPYANHVPVIVAEKDGDIGGFRPVLPLPIRVGDETVMSIQLVDLMVHPDHRRQGLMTKMYDWMKAECYDDYAVTFTYANEPSRRGMLKMNDDHVTYHDLGPFVKYERLQNLRAFTSPDQSVAFRLASRVASPLYRVKNGIQDRLKLTDKKITVTRHETVRPDILVEVYESVKTDRPHLKRDEALYEWRFDEPDVDFVMYSASRDGVREAAIVVGVHTSPEGLTSAHLTEVLPLAGGDALGATYSCLLGRIVADFADVDIISASAGAIPHQVLAAYGFLRSDSFPLSRFTDRSWFLVGLLGAPEADPEIADALIAETGWDMTFCERLLG